MQKWLQALTDEYLQSAEKLADSDEAGFQKLAAWMRDRFAAHGATELRQQRNPMTEVRATLRQRFGAEHLAVQTMNFSSEEWIQINSVIAQRAAAQNESQVILSPETVNALVSRATQLLLSRNWADVAAALAVLTGRRSTEVLKTASFTLKSPYSVVFTGALKRRGEATTLSFEIPTLCQAEYVVTALSKLRSALPTQTMTPKQVNQFADDVCAACNKHFADLIPAPQGRDNLYTHLFRKVYATIATYFDCPENVDEAEFRAHIQGHFSGHEHLTLAQRRTIESDRYYRSYCIQDDQGNMRKGVRLGRQGVEVLAVFRKTEIEDEATMGTPKQQKDGETAAQASREVPEVKAEVGRKRLVKRPGLPADLLDRMMLSMAERGVKGSYADVFEALLQSVDRLQTELTAEKQKNAGGLNAINWFTKQVDELRKRIDDLEQENATLKASEVELQSIAALKAENAQLQAELKTTQGKLETIQQLLSTATPTPIAPDQVPTPATAMPVAPVPAKALITAATAPAPTPAAVTDRNIQRNPEFLDTALDPDIERALFAIINHNKRVNSNDDRWAISVNAMKGLLKTIGKSYQPKIQEVLKAYSNAVDQHHAEFLLSSRHNRVHKDIPISTFISIAR
jgi:hypothetical protein